MDSKNPIQSADRIFNILETLADHGAMRLIDISECLQLHKSTVHRLLASLISMGYVRQNSDSGTYSLTFKIVGLSGKVLKNTDILSIIHPYAARLTELCDETVHFVQRADEKVVYLEKLESLSVKTRSIRMASQVGVTRAMYSSAVGKAILAELPDEEVKRIWSNSSIEKKTEHTITSYAALKKELAEIKHLGYALDNEENELGIRCIAVCIYDYSDTPNYALSISTVTSRMPDERISVLSSLLLQTKAELSAALGSNMPYKHNNTHETN